MKEYILQGTARQTRTATLPMSELLDPVSQLLILYRVTSQYLCTTITKINC